MSATVGGLTGECTVGGLVSKLNAHCKSMQGLNSITLLSLIINKVGYC